MLVPRRANCSPVIIGPMLIHYKKTFATYSSFRRELSNVKCFGTDGEEALIEVFQHACPASLHLMCSIRVEMNTKTKLQDIEYQSNWETWFLLTYYFSKKHGLHYNEGFVDATSCTTYYSVFESLTMNVHDLFLVVVVVRPSVIGRQLHSKYLLGRLQCFVLKSLCDHHVFFGHFCSSARSIQSAIHFLESYFLVPMSSTNDIDSSFADSAGAERERQFQTRHAREGAHLVSEAAEQLEDRLSKRRIRDRAGRTAQSVKQRQSITGCWDNERPGYSRDVREKELAVRQKQRNSGSPKNVLHRLVLTF